MAAVFNFTPTYRGVSPNAPKAPYLIGYRYISDPGTKSSPKEMAFVRALPESSAKSNVISITSFTVRENLRGIGQGKEAMRSFCERNREAVIVVFIDQLCPEEGVDPKKFFKSVGFVEIKRGVLSYEGHWYR